MYSALAGFVEPGETIEDCVRREVREEVGIEVDRIEYFASQPWPFPHSLMIAFTAHYAGGELRLDPAEIADARWFPLDALPNLPSPMSIARRLIDATVARLAARGTTPRRALEWRATLRPRAASVPLLLPPLLVARRSPLPSRSPCRRVRSRRPSA